MRPVEGPPGIPPTLHVNTERTWRGGEQQTLYLVKGLLARGLPAVLLCQPGSSLEARSRAEDVLVRAFRMYGEADLFAVLRIARLVARSGFRLIHAHTSHAHSLAALAAAIAPAPRPRVVVTRRVDFSIYRNSFLGLNGLKYRFGVDRFLAISEAVRNVMARDGVPPSKLMVIRSGTDVRRFERGTEAAALDPDYRGAFGVPAGAPFVGNVAYFADHKGQRTLVEAAPAILAARPAARIVLVGEGELREPLRRLAQALGVEGRVLFPGFRSDVPGLLRAFDVFVLPSHMEGLGTSILDAFAARTPVVATRTGGIPEIVRDGETGLLVPPRDPPALAAAVLRLIDDRALAARLSDAALRFVRAEHAIDATIDGTIEIYREVLSRERVATRCVMPPVPPGTTVDKGRALA